jgi:hypothetical protein
VSTAAATPTPGEPADDSVLVLRQAVAAAMAGWGRLPDTASPEATTQTHQTALAGARRLLNDLADTLAPAADALRERAGAAPGGPLTQVLRCLHAAVEHVDTGELSAARAALLTAFATLASLAPAEHDPGPTRPDWR